VAGLLVLTFRLHVIMALRHGWLLGTLVLLPSCATVGEEEAVLSELDRRAPEWLQDQGVASVAVAYVAGGEVRWTRAYGELSAGVPATPEALYNTASLAKPVVAELALRLAARGDIDLDEPMAAHWVDPDVADDPRHRQLTPRLVLSHRSGLPNWRYETGDVLRFIADPGTRFGYSGEGFEYLSRFLQEKLGAPLDTLVRRHLLQPLGMTSTAFTEQPWFSGRMARPHDEQGTELDPSVRTVPSAADDLYTTVGDYGAFLAAVMAEGALPAEISRQRDSIHALQPQEMQGCVEAVTSECPQRVGFGLGWSIWEYDGETLFTHTGGDVGERTIAYYVPARQEGAVVFTNGANGNRTYLSVLQLLFDDPPYVQQKRTLICGRARQSGVRLAECGDFDSAVGS
jgi:CubicO group peptidase (beta-lactamase class C family)